MSALGVNNLFHRSAGSRHSRLSTEQLAEQARINARMEAALSAQDARAERMERLLEMLLAGGTPAPRVREDRTSLLSDDATAGAFATPLQGAATVEAAAGRDDATAEAAVRRLTAGYVLPPAPLVPPLDLPQRSLKREARIV